MTWKITVAYIDDKTGEYTQFQETLTDQKVTYAKMDALDSAFQNIRDHLQLQLKEQTT